MKRQLRARSALVLSLGLLLAGCPKGTTPPPPAAPPSITSFTADATRINRGQSVKLSFKTERASEVTITDQTGSPVTTTGSAADGSATVSPTATSFYVLSAKGEGGLDSAFVQVAVEEGLRSVFLVAVPPAVKAGETATLVYSAFGGTNLSLTGGGMPVDLGGKDNGTVRVTPGKTTSYELKADGTAGPVTATATVTVAPVVTELIATPPVAHAGDTITLSWKTLGADAIALDERTFGAIDVSTFSAAAGSVDWVVPSTFSLPSDAGTEDAGTAGVVDGFPLSFTLTASTTSPVQSSAKTIEGAVGEGPAIFEFQVPATATAGLPMTISWRTNAHRVELLADGRTVLAPNAGQLTTGNTVVPAPTATSTLTLVAYDFNGFSVRESRQIAVVAPPTIATFTLPQSVASGGAPAAAAWTTTNATQVVIRVKNGPGVYVNTDPARVASGSASVYPSATTTFVLEAYNAAGDKATMEKKVEVSSPLNVTVTPDITTPNSDVELAWDITSAAPAEVVGIPANAARNPSSSSFVDLDTSALATTLTFEDDNDSVVTLRAPQGFTFPVLGDAYSTFTISTNGFISLTGGGASPDNVDLQTASAGTPLVVAPFWDDLDVQSQGMPDPGSVLWQVEGSAFPRRLIVQWSNVRITADQRSRLTFQAQLSETGAVKFIYKTLTDGDGTFSQGQTATIGLNLGVGRFNERISFNPASASINAGEEISWFASGAPAASVTLSAAESFAPGFFYRVGNNWTFASARVRVFGTGTVVVNEAMPTPTAAATAGQWLEVYNPGRRPLDIGGLEVLSTSAGSMPWLVPDATEIPAGGFIVLGQSTMASENDGANVSVAWASDLPLDATDGGVQVRAPTATPITISSMTWSSSTAGRSVQTEKAITSSGPLTCTRTRTFGTNGAIGTPGASNESCFPYTLAPTQVSFEDISGTATGIVGTGDPDEGYFTLPLPVPFTFGGTARQNITISTNGWVAFNGPTTAAITNKTLPSGTAPVGTVAAFWDDLDSNATGSEIYMARVGDHTVIEWKNYTHWNANDVLDFEIKLFDSGVIEFHYATMTSGSTSNYATGNSATIWVEAIDGLSALPVGINQAVMTPNSAYRFTPAN